MSTMSEGASSSVATTASTGEMKNWRFSNILRGRVISERFARKNDTVASSNEVRKAKAAPVARAGRIDGQGDLPDSSRP